MTVIQTTAHLENDHKPPPKTKKARNKKRKARKTKHKTTESPSESDLLIQDAQTQLEQEMKDAGMENCLPLSFSSHRSNRKRQRTEEFEEYIDEEVIIPASTSHGALVSRTKVVYDSDGNVISKTPEQVELPLENEITAVENTSESSNNATKETQKDNDNTEPPPDLDKSVHKFWHQRLSLFERFEEGIQLDHESWFSVTPQTIAEDVAERCRCDVLIDAFTGCGGNAIQFARTCRHVIAIDIDPTKIRMAKHNARVYGVEDRIEFIVGDSISLLPQLSADVVFLSPPWGGMEYNRKFFKLSDIQINGTDGTRLFELARQVTPNVAYYLPKTTPTGAVSDLTSSDEEVEYQKVFLNESRKVTIAYYGNLVVSKEKR